MKNRSNKFKVYSLSPQLKISAKQQTHFSSKEKGSIYNEIFNYLMLNQFSFGQISTLLGILVHIKAESKCIRLRVSQPSPVDSIVTDRLRFLVVFNESEESGRCSLL